MNDSILSSLISNLALVCVLGGDIIPDKGTRYGYRSSRGLEPNKVGPVFSYERVQAAAELWRKNRSLRLLVSGGSTPGAPERPPISTVMAYELGDLDVRPGFIIEEDSSKNTWEQIQACASQLRDRHNTIDPKKIGILAPVWQLPRIATMLFQKPSDVFPFQAGLTHFLSIERILMAVEPDKWGPFFVERYQEPGVWEVFVKELLGGGQICAGHQPEFPHPYTSFHDPLGRFLGPM